MSLFHNEPMLAPELLERVFGIRIPDHTTATLEDPTLTQVAPTEYFADAVVVVRGDQSVQAIVVEVQLGRDTGKRYSWPVYTATLQARLRCPVALLVVTPDPDVAAWARQPIELGPGSTYSPLVVGPDLIPTITSLDEARRNPELAVLSVLAHGTGAKAEAVATAALRAVGDLDADRATLYSDLILSALDQAVKAGLEELMKTKYEYQSDFVKKYVAQGHRVGREEGLQEGLQGGLEEGLEEGRQTWRAVLRRRLQSLGVKLDSDSSEQLDAAETDILERIVEDLFVIHDPRKILEAIQSRLRDTD